MHKLKLAVALPCIQFALATALLYFEGPSGVPRPIAKLVCDGLTAPAYLLAKLIYLSLDAALDVIQIGSAWRTRVIYGFSLEDIFFLAGVIVVWWLVGRAIDRRAFPKPESRSRTALTWHALLLALGGLLFYASLNDYMYPIFFSIPRLSYRGILTFVWACSLIYISGRGLARAIRPSSRESV